MRITITLCRQTQDECSDDKTDNAFLFRRENESVSQLFPMPTVGKFQSGSGFTRGRTRTDG
jgi:hypothetical protein